jgi:hypothetical protein
MRFKSKRCSKRRKKQTNVFCKLKTFFSCYFWITPFLLHFKYDFYDEDINKCLVISRLLVMGQSTLAQIIGQWEIIETSPKLTFITH